MDQQTTIQRICKIIAEQADMRIGDVHPNHELVSDLHLDSLDIIEIMIYLEEEFDIVIDEDEFAQFKAVEHIIQYILLASAESIAPPSTACREQQIATLNKAALDAMMELDWLKNELEFDADKRNQIISIINRVNDASTALAI